jgi:hypothetical protein
MSAISPFFSISQRPRPAPIATPISGSPPDSHH